MKSYDSEDLVTGERYFFVWEGVVYYGWCVGGDPKYYNNDEPVSFEIYRKDCGSYEKLCNVWETTLIYTL